MTMLAETVDAVIGTGTHRDTHEVEIADPAGKPIAVLRIANDSAGFERLLAAIAEVAPGPTPWPRPLRRRDYLVRDLDVVLLQPLTACLA